MPLSRSWIGPDRRSRQALRRAAHPEGSLRPDDGPESWLLRPSLRREVFACQLGAVQTRGMKPTCPGRGSTDAIGPKPTAGQRDCLGRVEDVGRKQRPMPAAHLHFLTVSATRESPCWPCSPLSRLSGSGSGGVVSPDSRATPSPSEAHRGMRMMSPRQSLPT